MLLIYKIFCLAYKNLAIVHPIYIHSGDAGLS